MPPAILREVKNYVLFRNLVRSSSIFCSAVYLHFCSTNIRRLCFCDDKISLGKKSKKCYKTGRNIGEQSTDSDNAQTKFQSWDIQPNTLGGDIMPLVIFRTNNRNETRKAAIESCQWDDVKHTQSFIKRTPVRSASGQRSKQICWGRGSFFPSKALYCDYYRTKCYQRYNASPI